MTFALDQTAYEQFVSGDIWTKWDGARRLMAARQMQAAANQPDFDAALDVLASLCIQTVDVEQLLAIALAVRISELVKGRVRDKTAQFLGIALSKPPIPLRTISEARKLPTEAKASEVRENIALAFTYANGPWVVDYLIDALGWEERSTRCRIELLRQLSRRESRATVWLERLAALPWLEILPEKSADRAGRLRDIADSLSVTLSTQRNLIEVDKRTGPALAEMMQKIVFVSRTGHRPARLTSACESALSLLDQILVSEFTLISDPETYSPLEVISRWWQNAYPPELLEALANIARKIASAIRLLARLGQRSEKLVTRLRQARGSGELAAEVLVTIADTETGLDPNIDDWLRGNLRESSVTASAISTLLASAADFEMANAIASLLLDSVAAREKLTQASDSVLGAEIRRLASRIDALAAQLDLEIQGNLGEIVQYNSEAHRTLDGTVPAEPEVRIIRPMVVRLRKDGSQDIVERAIVGEL